jgi:serine/threonine-protein kinase
VYLAQRLDDPSALVAFKVLMPSPQLSPQDQRAFYVRFQRETQAAERLHHPHILPVLRYGDEANVAYMVLPFMSNGTLATRLANFPHGLPLDEASQDLAQLAEALDFAHAHGIVHRDIKPTNVLIDGQGQLVLADLGIARLLDPASSDPAGGQPITKLTATGQVLGTPIYMAPEQLVSARVGPSADMYALGILLYELVTGEVPFQAPTPVGLALQHVQDPPPPPRTLRPDLPAPAEAAILKALSKAPEDRFTSAGALARAFAAGLHGEWSEGLAPPVASASKSFNSAATMAETWEPPRAGSPTSYSPNAPTIASTGLSVGSSSPSAQRRSGISTALLAGIASIVVLAVVLGTLAIGLHLGAASNTPRTSGGNPGGPSTTVPGSRLTPTSGPLQLDATRSSTPGCFNDNSPCCFTYDSASNTFICKVVLSSPNANATAIQWTASAVIASPDPAVTVSTSPSSGTLAPGQQIDVLVTIPGGPGNGSGPCGGIKTTVTFTGGFRPVVVQWSTNMGPC